MVTTPPRPPAPTGPFTVKRAPGPSGGGFSTTMQARMSGDQLVMVVDGDVSGGLIRYEGDSAWRNLLTRDNMPAEIIAEAEKNATDYRYNGGSYSTTISPDGQWLITGYRGMVLRRPITPDGVWERTALDPLKMWNALGYDRFMGRSISWEERGCLIGTTDDGVWFSTDGFRDHVVKVTQAGGAPLPALGKDIWNHPTKHLTAFLPDGTAVVHCDGAGVFLGDPEQGLSLVAGSPPWASDFAVCPTTGALYVCARLPNNRDGYGDSLMRYHEGIWTTIRTRINPFSVGVDWSDPNHVIFCNENGGWGHTYSAWEETPLIKWFDHVERGDGEDPWLSNVSKRNFPSDIAQHPVNPTEWFMTEGVGENRFTAPVWGDDTITFHSITLGDYKLLSTTGLSLAGEPTILLGAMDKGAVRVQGDQYLDFSYAPRWGEEFKYSAIAHARSLDHANGVTLGVFSGQVGSNGYSLDFGKTWNALKPPEGQPLWLPGGDCTVIDRNRFGIVQGNNGLFVHTENAGQTWSPVLIDGETVGGQINAEYVQRDCLCSDKTRPGVVAFVHNNHMTERNPDMSWVQNARAGLWISEDGFAGPWERTITGLIDEAPGRAHSAQYWAAKLTYIDGVEGEMLYAPFGAHSGGVDNLVWMKNDGREVIDLPVRKLRGFDFGVRFAGQRYPTLWFWGEYAGVMAWWRTKDWFETVEMVAEHPLGTIAGPTDGMVADRNADRCFMGIGGNGWVEARA